MQAQEITDGVVRTQPDDEQDTLTGLRVIVRACPDLSSRETLNKGMFG